MGRFFACAGLGTFLTFAASILAIFAQISQINSNIVPRNIRMVTVNTAGVGQALGVGNAIYGSGARNAANTGLRPSYQWGLWAYCEAQTEGGVRDACSGTSWAHTFQPVPAILFDVPAAEQQAVSNLLGNGTFTASDYLGRFSKGAFYVLFIGAVLGGLPLITGFLAHRFAFLVAAILTLLAFLCEAVGCIIWTIIIHKSKSAVNGLNAGITVSYGNALWIYWASTGCLLFAILPYIFGCIAGRDSYSRYY